MVGTFFRRHITGPLHFASLKDLFCLVAPQEADSTRQTNLWPRVGLGHYAVLRATNALRAAAGETASGSALHGRAWSCLRAGLAEALRGSIPLVKWLPAWSPQPPQATTTSTKRSPPPPPQQPTEEDATHEQQVLEARRLPPGARLRPLIALM